MLSSDLLRTKTSRGKIEPLFCALDFGNGTDYELANKLVTFFENTHKKGMQKGELLKKIATLESEFDYKLVRGLFALLERRSVFKPNLSSQINFVLIRQSLFQESSARGLALSNLQRQKIIQTVANRFNLSVKDIETIMWADREENLSLKKFDFISPKNLLLWYNLSLTQTLLFRCATLEFFIEGGIHWKHVLRNVKKLGLMYNLEYQLQSDPNSIRCTIEGPLSLFKMTDKYGTSMAKLLPQIIGAPIWSINGSIVRKNDEGSKIYQFALSNKSTAGFLQPMSEILYSDNSSNVNNQGNGKNDNDSYNYDSSLEKKFEKLFLQYFNKKDDWKISREPNPLVADGKAMIPDFLFERYGKKVYFEIVGFWTQEYLERKAAKLRAIFDKNRQNHHEIDLIVGVNSDLACSQIESISDDRIFTFKKEVSIKPILKHLKEIDKKIIEEKTNTTSINLNENSGEVPKVISIQAISEKYDIPAETALKILSSSYTTHKLVGRSVMISKEKIGDIQKNLKGIVKFTEACKVLESNQVPESSHADLLSELGYDVVWNDLNPNNTTINKKILKL